MKTFLCVVLSACGGVTFTDPPFRGAPDAGPEASDARLFVDMLGDPAAKPLPGPKPQPSICPVPGQACTLPSPFQQTCLNGESYWQCVDGGWQDRWCGAYPAAICNGDKCVEPVVCP